MRVFVTYVADKSFLLVVPALEVAPCEAHQVLIRSVGEDGDVLFGDIADRFIVGTKKRDMLVNVNYL